MPIMNEARATWRNTDTRAATVASKAAAARRRHAKYIEELREAGVTVIVPDGYTGLPVQHEA